MVSDKILMTSCRTLYRKSAARKLSFELPIKLVYTTQVNNAYKGFWLAKYYSLPSSRKKTKMVYSQLIWYVSYYTFVLYTNTTIIHLSAGESGGYLPQFSVLTNTFTRTRKQND